MITEAISDRRDDLDYLTGQFPNPSNWNGRTVILGGSNCDCAQRAIKGYEEVFEFLETQAKIYPDDGLVDDVQEVLKASRDNLKEELLETDDLDAFDLIIGSSKRDVLAAAALAESAAKAVKEIIDQIFGTVGALFSSLVICMGLRCAKQAVIDGLALTKRISPRELRMIMLSDTIDAVTGQALDLLKRELEEGFTVEEKMRLPELRALVAKEFSRHISTGLRLDGQKGGDDKTDLNYSKLDTVFANPAYLSLKNGGIGFINGICNHIAEAKENACILSDYAHTAISLVHNATHYGIIDLIECLIGKLGVPTHPETLLRLQWEEFFDTHEPSTKFLQICHSQGAIHVKNALRHAPESIRRRIMVLAIAPAAIITSEDCHRSWNYASKHDIIPFLNPPKEMSHLILLTPDPQAPLFDHNFDSPTYRDAIQRVVTGYLQVYGEKS